MAIFTHSAYSKGYFFANISMNLSLIPFKALKSMKLKFSTVLLITTMYKRIFLRPHKVWVYTDCSA
jgi:hypothetical protein